MKMNYASPLTAEVLVNGQNVMQDEQLSIVTVSGAPANEDAD